MPIEPFTWEFLSSFAGLVAVVALIVQFTKKPVKRWLGDGAVRYYAYFWTLIVQGYTLTVQVLDGTLPMDNLVKAIGLAMLNGIMASLAASGAHDYLRDPKAKK